MKMKRRILMAVLGILVGMGGAGMAHAATPATVTFEATDDPGSWFECATTGTTKSIGCVPESVAGTGQKSLAVLQPGETVAFVSKGRANTLHTAVSLMIPTGVAFFDIGDPLVPPVMGGNSAPSTPLTLTTPGLYVFFCDIHPYMFAAVIVDDPKTTNGLDLGLTVDLPHVSPGGLTASPNGVTGLPTASDLVLRLVHTFFVATNPHNWQDYRQASWNPSYPPVPVLASSDGHTENVFVPDLNAFFHTHFSEPKALSAPIHPTHPGVGQVWVDTQFEMMKEKTKPGTATAVNATSWAVERKVGLPHHGTSPGEGMNNPHNMWTDKDQTVIYQTEWFDNYLTVFDRNTGAFLNRIPAGDAPAHVMTRVGNDFVHVSQNAGNNVRELASLTAGNHFVRDIPMSIGGDVHPHAHWMSADGSMMVTPNEDSEDSTLYSFNLGAIAATTTTGHGPIATGMMPDSSKYYVANFLDSTLSVIGLTGFPSVPHVTTVKTINLLGNYNPVTGAVSTPVGALPIQTPVSPDGRFVATANTLTATITIIDTKTDTVVKGLGCDPGCHGVQWGAKKGGGYYAYVSSKFSNRMLVVDPDPNGALAPNDGSNAVIAGQVLLTGPGTDGTVNANAGMGGQGVLSIPVVYNGWVQELPASFKALLTTTQQTATK
jgi:DNA-binding beta-propeller fold protein YncE/plastocyanin